MEENIKEFLPRLIKSNIPKKYQTQEECNKAVIENPKLIGIIPQEFITQEMCNYVFQREPELISIIPQEFITQEMCNKIIAYYPNLIHTIPKKFITEEIAENIIKNHQDFISKIPMEIFTREFCQKLLILDLHNISYIPKEKIKENISKEDCKNIITKFPELVTKLPEEFIDEELAIQIILKKHELIDTLPEKIINKNFCLKLISIDPKLINIVPKNIKIKDENGNEYTFLEYIIINELEKVTLDGGSIEELSKKYNVSKGKIDVILEKIKQINIEFYTKIKTKLLINQKIWIINMNNDLNNLSKIILSLDSIESGFINRQQKIKFAYLYRKYIRNSLEDIYTFSKKYQSEIDNYDIINNFFTRVLKFNRIKKENEFLPERYTIEFNNKWLKDFNKGEYFNIKNGIPTTKNQYADREITVDDVDNIITILKSYQIPLNDMIVKDAVRQQFNGTLVDYINNLLKYDEIIKIDNNKVK